MLRLGTTIKGIFLCVNFDAEFVFEKLGKGAIRKIEDISAVHIERIVNYPFL